MTFKETFTNTTLFTESLLHHCLTGQLEKHETGALHSREREKTVSMVTQMVVHSFKHFNWRHFCQKHQASEGTSGLERDRQRESLS